MKGKVESLLTQGKLPRHIVVILDGTGRLWELPSDVYEVLVKTIEKTKLCKEMTLTLALSYGGREEIIDAIKKIISDGISPEDLHEEIFSQFLYTSNLPEPDLLIRTSGEIRLSNFLLWQLAYTEIYVTKTLWPDFKKKHLIRALINYQNRERRFGLTSDQIRYREVNYKGYPFLFQQDKYKLKNSILYQVY